MHVLANGQRSEKADLIIFNCAFIVLCQRELLEVLLHTTFADIFQSNFEKVIKSMGSIFHH